jgi:carboxypeptidase C (cathepsin A)
VTFLYNGGPGSATIWLEMGSVGPVRVLSNSPEPTNNPPFKVVPNEYSLLDKTDLVFIDAPGTGYSHPVGKGTIKDVAGVDEDLTAFTKFISATSPSTIAGTRPSSSSASPTAPPARPVCRPRSMKPACS